jgi:dipeptidyl aminopeptidase/acylaminoacyl peptidase
LSEADGQQLIFSVLDPVEGKGAEIQRVVMASNLMQSYEAWSLSPDGSKIAIIKRGLVPGGDVWILTLADHKVMTLALQGWKWDQVQSVAWSADGSHLFVTAFSGPSTALLFIDLHGDLQVLAEAPQGAEWLYEPVPSPDGRYLAYMKRTYESNVTMLEHF